MRCKNENEAAKERIKKSSSLSETKLKPNDGRAGNSASGQSNGRGAYVCMHEGTTGVGLVKKQHE